MPTQSGAKFLSDQNSPHLTTVEFKERYDVSARAQAIRMSIAEPLGEEFVLTKEETQAFKARYHNSSFNSLKILVGRELLLWARDRYQIKARLMQGKSRLL